MKLPLFLAELLPHGSFYVLCNGKLVQDWQSFVHDSTHDECCEIRLRLCGGKGGFGSLLRSFGSQFYRSTNQDMCRDLSGRRVRDVKQEEKLKKWIEMKAERDRQRETKRQEKLERLTAETKHNFTDNDYFKAKQSIAEKTEDAVEQGLKAASGKTVLVEDTSDGPSGSDAQITVGVKRGKGKEIDDKKSGAPPAKRRALWWDKDELTGSSDDDEHHSSSSDTDEVSQSSLTCTKEEASSSHGVAPENSQPTKAEPIPISTTVIPPVAPLLSPAKEEPPVLAASTVVSATNSMVSEAKPVVQEVFDAINLDLFGSAKELEKLGLNWLKAELTRRGLKCGGSLMERSRRLWAVKGLKAGDYPAELLAKK